MREHLLIIISIVGGCRLNPLVGDKPGASVNVLPPGTVVPDVTENAELTNQITLNNGLDPKVLAMTGGVVVPGIGMAAGSPVSFWSFGNATRAPSPLYLFGKDNGAGFEPIAHLPLVAALPGDAAYNPIHNIYQVVVTDAYHGELMTTPAALDDAFDLGLVSEPMATSTFTNGPIVLPDTSLGGATPAAPQQVYGQGYIVDMFRFGGALNVQPGSGFLPTSQVSFLREDRKATYDATRPIFQATIPTVPPAMKPNYTPLTIVVDVDLAPGVVATTITQDSDLFVRSAAGAVMGTTPNVAQFSVTTTTLDMQLQFVTGQP